MQRLSKWSPLGLSLLRIMTGLLYMVHGSMKLFHYPPGGPSMPASMQTLMLVAGVLELVGGFLVAIGLFTRPVAFLLSGMMAVAYFMAHASRGFWPALNGGDAAILYCFIFLYLVFAGPGSIAADNMMRRRRS